MVHVSTQVHGYSRESRAWRIYQGMTWFPSLVSGLSDQVPDDDDAVLKPPFEQ